MINAMGLAYSQTAGNSQNLLEGTLAIRFCQGLAAQAGVIPPYSPTEESRPQRKFFRGNLDISRSISGENMTPEAIGRSGETLRSMNVTRKAYPCCMHTHAAIDAVTKHLTNKFPLARRDRKDRGPTESARLQLCLIPEQDLPPRTGSRSPIQPSLHPGHGFGERESIPGGFYAPGLEKSRGAQDRHSASNAGWTTNSPERPRAKSPRPLWRSARKTEKPIPCEWMIGKDRRPTR